MRRIIAATLAITLVLSGCGKQKVVLEPTKYQPSSVTKDAGVITFLDLESCTTVLIQNGSYTILVDTGDEGSYSDLQSELAARSIAAIDCLIITSPEKHRTGSAAKILNDYNVRHVLQPKWDIKTKSSTSTYIDFTQQLQIKSTPITYTNYGFTTTLGSVKFTALGPQGDTYLDLNGHSMICKFQFGMVSFVYMSGAHSALEQELISGRITTRTDILMPATFVAKDSNTAEFIQTLAPVIVIAPRERKNPDEEQLLRYTDSEAELHKIKDHGNIVITTDGKNIGVTSDYYNLNTEGTTDEIK